MSRFVKKISNTTDPEVRASARERIHHLLRDRAAALHRGDREAAVRFSLDLIKAYTLLGENSPVFEPTITVHGETRYFNGFTEDGSARYTREDNLIKWWWHLAVPQNATEQREQHPTDRLLREHRVSSYVRGFGHADDLVGKVLWAQTIEREDLTASRVLVLAVSA